VFQSLPEPDSRVARLVSAFAMLWLLGLIAAAFPGQPRYRGLAWWTPLVFVFWVVLIVFLLRNRLWAAVVAPVVTLGALYADAHLIVVDYGATPRAVFSAAVDGVTLIVVLMLVWTIRRVRLSASVPRA
jgi:hypothetical protein